MADGARVPGVRMVADGAWVRVDMPLINSNVARFARSMFIKTAVRTLNRSFEILNSAIGDYFQL